MVASFFYFGGKMGAKKSLESSLVVLCSTCEAFEKTIISTKVHFLNFDKYPIPHP
nr:MAG TPA: hypothetical protein [Caudoviricetes sp.]